MERAVFTYRLGKPIDIPQIQQLNIKWLIPDVSEADRVNGFLFGDPLKASDLEKIIFAKELTVAQFEYKIVGYYLFDNFSDTKILKEYNEYINELIKEGKITPNIRVSKRAQAVIDKNYQNIGLSKELLKLLLINIKDKYDILFSVVSKLNPKIIAHQKAGWKIIGENEDLFFVQYSL